MQKSHAVFGVLLAGAMASSLAACGGDGEVHAAVDRALQRAERQIGRAASSEPLAPEEVVVTAVRRPTGPFMLTGRDYRKFMHAVSKIEDEHNREAVFKAVQKFPVVNDAVAVSSEGVELLHEAAGGSDLEAVEKILFESDDYAAGVIYRHLDEQNIRLAGDGYSQLMSHVLSIESPLYRSQMSDLIHAHKKPGAAGFLAKEHYEQLNRISWKEGRAEGRAALNRVLLRVVEEHLQAMAAARETAPAPGM